MVADNPRRWPTVEEADSPLYRHAYAAGRAEGALLATLAWGVLAGAFLLGWLL